MEVHIDHLVRNKPHTLQIYTKHYNTQDKVFVALSKRVALSLWVVAAFPQIYEYFSKGRSDSIFGFDDSDPNRPLCYATYVYPTWAVRKYLPVNFCIFGQDFIATFFFICELVRKFTAMCFTYQS